MYTASKELWMYTRSPKVDTATDRLGSRKGIKRKQKKKKKPQRNAGQLQINYDPSIIYNAASYYYLKVTCLRISASSCHLPFSFPPLLLSSLSSLPTLLFFSSPPPSLCVSVLINFIFFHGSCSFLLFLCPTLPDFPENPSFWHTHYQHIYQHNMHHAGDCCFR